MHVGHAELSRETARLGPGGDDQAIERDVRSVSEGDRPGVEIERCGRDAEAQRHTEIVDRLALAQPDPVDVPGPGE